jgi:hypothetical protein
MTFLRLMVVELYPKMSVRSVRLYPDLAVASQTSQPSGAGPARSACWAPMVTLARPEPARKKRAFGR